ncbi:hypothetical protein pah_c014o023 [Parachlamydia acanthamoebae str. Hall's coccus]|nr:hypothetical protein pah_c014o023 [Parachlamydia acanthamoebae str. Hall's coccus]
MSMGEIVRIEECIFLAFGTSVQLDCGDYHKRFRLNLL